jgi:hypothetical protein
MRFLFAALFLISANAWGQPAGQFAIWGVGADSCGSYALALQDHRPRQMLELRGVKYGTPSYVYSEWIAGYLSAINRVRLAQKKPQTAVNVDADGYSLWIKNYCEKYPTTLLVHVVDRFVDAH